MLNQLTANRLDLRLYKIFRKMGVPREQVSLKANLTNDLFFDNNDMNILLFFLESKFNININDGDLPQLKTIGQTLHYIEERLDIAS